MNYLKLLFLIVLFLPAQSQAQQKITVSTAQEFIQAIGSDRTILLKPGTYVLSDLSVTENNEHVVLRPSLNGNEVLIQNVKNLQIKSQRREKAELITRPEYGQVLIFQNCENIRLEKVIAGHGPEKGYCEGGVFLFENSKQITLRGCTLYGSGTYGIETSQVEKLTVLGTTIKECTYGIMILNETQNVTFANCLFKGNEEFGLVILNEVSEASFGSCTFRNNRSGEYEGYLFQVTGKETAEVVDCNFIANDTQYLANSRKGVEFRDCKFNGNNFRNGKYPEE